MYFLNFHLNGELVGTTEHASTPFVPRISDQILIGGVKHRVLLVQIEYTGNGTEISVFLERI